MRATRADSARLIKIYRAIEHARLCQFNGTVCNYRSGLPLRRNAGIMYESAVHSLGKLRRSCVNDALHISRIFERISVICRPGISTRPRVAPKRQQCDIRPYNCGKMKLPSLIRDNEHVLSIKYIRRIDRPHASFVVSVKARVIVHVCTWTRACTGCVVVSIPFVFPSERENEKAGKSTSFTDCMYGKRMQLAGLSATTVIRVFSGFNLTNYLSISSLSLPFVLFSTTIS